MKREKLQITEQLRDKLCDLIYADLDEYGREIHNPEPVVLNVGLNRPPTLQEQIQRLIKVNLSNQVAEQGEETFEESQDFDIEDSFDQALPATFHEMLEDAPIMQEEPPPVKEEPTPAPDPAAVPPSPETKPALPQEPNEIPPPEV